MSDPRENLLGAFDLFQMGLDMMRAKLRREHPDESEQDIERRVGDWLATRPGAEDGDGVGKPGTWPRKA